MNEHDRILAVVDATLKHPEPTPPPLDSKAVEETIAFLSSDAARARVNADPYWPKWDSPWWRIAAMEEAGLAAHVPPAAVQMLAEAANAKYLHHFPLRAEEVPPGTDGTRDILCHCAAGTLDRVFRSCGVEIDRVMPWLRSWYLRYALPDGGWNCDEAAYTRPVPRSSFLSTLPMLEALLERPELSGEEGGVLDRGARYLLERRLCRSLSRDAVADPDWLKVTFPRFYDYDVLRGLTFMVRWARRRGAKLPASALVEVVELLAQAAGPDGTLTPARRGWDGAKTLERDASGAWTRGHPAHHFPLLEDAGRTDRPSAALTRSWRGTLEALRPVLGA